ncbi:MAG: hypothetical protein K5764_09220, partial [Prevotella sp.]|nr:hypothetical protein [Prevotella sp.]
PGDSSKKLYIGCDVNGSGNPEFAFQGEVVVARMYSQALSAKEVQSVYDALKSGETGIFTVENDSAKADTGIYTLTGIRVSQPQARGIYIINGKKVFKK